MENFLRENLLRSLLIGIEFGVIATAAILVFITFFSILTNGI